MLFFWIPRCHMRTPTPKAANPAMFHASVLLSTGLLKRIDASAATDSVAVEFVGVAILDSVETNLYLQCDHLPVSPSVVLGKERVRYRSIPVFAISTAIRWIDLAGSE